jgi:hypothetical protein
MKAFALISHAIFGKAADRNQFKNIPKNLELALDIDLPTANDESGRI